MQERARLVLCLARGEARPEDLAMREGISEAVLEAWVREFLHAAPERFDEAMKHTLVQHGLASAGTTTQQSGRLEDVGPLDLLQSLSIYRRPGHVLFFHAHGTSQLWFRGGQIVDAASGALRGAAAVYRIVGHQQGDFLVEVTGDDHPAEIEPSGQALVFEAARRLDESQRIGLPPADVVLTAPHEALMMTPDLDESGRQLAKLFEPGATVGEVLERSPLGELETRMTIAALVKSGLLRPTGDLRAPQIPSHERRLEALQQVGFTTSRPIVTTLMQEPLELAPIPAERRPWAHALIGGLVVGLMGTGAWLWMSDTPVPAAASAPAPTLVAPRVGVAPVAEAPPPIAVGTPAPPAAEIPATPEEAENPAAAPAKTSRRGAKARSKSRSKPSVRSNRSEPSQGDATPTKSSPKPKSAAALLDAARQAYASGQGAKAYQLASRSHSSTPSPEAAKLKVLAACLDGKPSKARQALGAVPRLRRGKVRQACKREHGVKLKRRK